MLIDAHTHLGPFNKILATAEQLIHSMDEASIDYSIVIADNFRNDPRGIRMPELINISKKTPRLKIVGEVSISNLKEDQINYLKQNLENKNICGLKFYPGYENFFPYDQRLYPLYQFCSDNGYPVIFHTGYLEVNTPGHMKQSHPLHIDDVAQDFPRLKIIIAHLGNPWLLDTAAIMYRNKNIYTDVSAQFAEYQTIKPSSVSNFISDMKVFKYNMGNYKRIIFGTDFPLYSQKEYVEAVNMLDLTAEEKDLVFWKNAATIFNLTNSLKEGK